MGFLTKFFVGCCIFRKKFLSLYRLGVVAQGVFLLRAEEFFYD